MIPKNDSDDNWDLDRWEFIKESKDVKEKVAQWLTENYGEKCGDFEPNCVCCQHWKLFEDLFAPPF